MYLQVLFVYGNTHDAFRFGPGCVQTDRIPAFADRCLLCDRRNDRDTGLTRPAKCQSKVGSLGVVLGNTCDFYDNVGILFNQ